MNNEKSTTQYSSPPPPQYGWICPKCGRVYAPNITSCFYCINYPPTGAPWWTTPPYWTVTCDATDTTIHSSAVGGSDYYNPSTHTYSNVTTAHNNTNKTTT